MVITRQLSHVSHGLHFRWEMTHAEKRSRARKQTWQMLNAQTQVHSSSTHTQITAQSAQPMQVHCMLHRRCKYTACCITAPCYSLWYEPHDCPSVVNKSAGRVLLAPACTQSCMQYQHALPTPSRPLPAQSLACAQLLRPLLRCSKQIEMILVTGRKHIDDSAYRKSVLRGQVGERS